MFTSNPVKMQLLHNMFSAHSMSEYLLLMFYLFTLSAILPVTIGRSQAGDGGGRTGAGRGPGRAGGQVNPLTTRTISPDQ